MDNSTQSAGKTESNHANGIANAGKTEPFDYCDHPCNGPIQGRTRAHIAISHAVYWLWMHLPHSLATGRFGMAILPRVGCYAFACTCLDKNEAFRLSTLTKDTDA